MKASGFHLESVKDGQHSAFQSDLLIISIDKYLCCISGLSLSTLYHLPILFPVTPSFGVFLQENTNFSNRDLSFSPRRARLPARRLLCPHLKDALSSHSGNLVPDFHTFSSFLICFENAWIRELRRVCQCSGMCWDCAWGEARAG